MPLDLADPNPRYRPLDLKSLRIGDLIRYIDERGRPHNGSLVSIHRGLGILRIEVGNGRVRSVRIRFCYQL